MNVKLSLAAVSAVALLGLAAPASAQSVFGGAETYGSLGYTQYRIDDSAEGVDVEDLDIEFGAVTGRLGAKFNPYFGAEGELQVGVNDYEENLGGVQVSGGLNYSASVFAVGYLPVSPQFDVFARLGIGVTEVEAEASGFGQSVSEDESGTTFAYGLGAQYFFDGLNGVRADYTRYDGEDSSAEADSLSLSYVRKF